MRNNLLLAAFLFLFTCPLLGQTDTIQPNEIENITTATLKTKELSVDLTSPEDVDLAIKKIHTFKYLQTIILDGEADETLLKKLLYRLSVLKNLENITFRENELTKIPENIAGIKNLRSLTIEGSSSMDYDALFPLLKNTPVTQLSLLDNDLKKIPASVSELVTLRKIQISGSNQLNYTDLVEQLAKLPNLNTLSIAVNYITELPENISKLKSLQILDVSDNNLTELPGQISALKAINNLSIQGNLLFDPAKDLEKLKNNDIQYLALDKEISGEDLEQIKKMFPAAQIDFPVKKEEEETTESTTQDAVEATKQPHSGELKAKKETYILSAAYLLYPVLFQNLNYRFDTLNFEERYNDLRYENTYRMVNTNSSLRGSSFYFRRQLIGGEKRGQKHEIWFRPAMNDPAVSLSYPELRAFTGMYWVYRGSLSKKQFARSYLYKKEGHLFKKSLRRWNDVRINFDKNNSLFTIQLKNDTGFVQFEAYPRISTISVEKSQEFYNQRYIIYQKNLVRRSQKFKRDFTRNKNRYDVNYKKMKEYAWKELQLRMSNDEKIMSQDDWLLYYDDIIAGEQKAIDNTPLSGAFILRGLLLRNYTLTSQNTLAARTGNPADKYTLKQVDADFFDANGGGKLAVTNIMVLDNKNKTVVQAAGSLGLSPSPIQLRQYSAGTVLVELRNGNWGCVSAAEIDKQLLLPNNTCRLNVTVLDKNLNTIGDLLHQAIK